MGKQEKSCCNEKFRTTIGGQALIEGIMMRGPEKDAIVVRKPDGLQIRVSERKIHSPKSPASWPFLRGIVNFFDAQVVGVKALMRSGRYNFLDREAVETEEERQKIYRAAFSADAYLTSANAITERG